MRTGIRALLTVVLLAATTACGVLAERRDDALATVTGFEQALRTGQKEALCAALAPGTREEVEQSAKSPCEQAMEDEEIPQAGAVRHVDVYGDQARAVLDHDTVFLAHFPAGWKVTAAGCLPRSGQPYQCTVKGR
ncbi:hypothetical protein AB0K89_18570 [Streptomyces cinnamoneus]|uniref:hypothetical protein n=1 Tax=Streptomyces cinnamoneus TaxID=53446 RepID=UPI00341F3914